MNFLVDKKGNLSWLRVSILIAVFGVLFLVGSIFAFVIDQSSRNTPLMIDVPQGAVRWGGDIVQGENWKYLYYRIPGNDLDVVAEFYQTKMILFYGGSGQGNPGETCQRFPPAGYFTNKPNESPQGGIYDPEFIVNESLPVVWKCLFDHSGLNNLQTTEVWIYQGQADPDPNRDSTGYVVIRHEQRWQS
jgi:hypothetical protein